MTWQASIEDNILSRHLRLVVGRYLADGGVEVLDAGNVIRSYPAGVAIDSVAGIYLPRDAVTAVTDALARHQGEYTDRAMSAQLRTDYLSERARVDKMLDHLMRSTP